MIDMIEARAGSSQAFLCEIHPSPCKENAELTEFWRSENEFKHFEIEFHNFENQFLSLM